MSRAVAPSFVCRASKRTQLQKPVLEVGIRSGRAILATPAIRRAILTTLAIPILDERRAQLVGGAVSRGVLSLRWS